MSVAEQTEVAAAVVTTPAEDAFCSIERTVGIIGDKWSLLILREVLTLDVHRFSDLRQRLGVATNMLANRLETLTRSGVLERRDYQEPGERARKAYYATPAGADLLLLLGALGQWGDDHIPPVGGVAQTRIDATRGTPVRVVFAPEDSGVVPAQEVSFVYTAAGEQHVREAAEAAATS